MSECDHDWKRVERHEECRKCGAVLPFMPAPRVAAGIVRALADKERGG